MPGRLSGPGVDVYQIIENRRPSNLKPAQVPCIFGVHKNIQRQLPLVYHKELSISGVVSIASNAIPTGNNNVATQIFSSMDDIDVFISTTRGLIELTRGAAWAANVHYTASIDTSLGINNLISLSNSMTVSKVLVSSTADSIVLNASGGTNFVVFSDSTSDYNDVGVIPGDLVGITFSTSTRNTASTYTGLTLSITDVLGPAKFRAAWSDNNGSWSDDASVSYTVNTPELTSVSGQVYVSYDNAVVTNNAAELFEINSAQEARDYFGEYLEPENPLGFHTLMALIATDRTFYAMRVTGETVADYEAALETLQASEDAYYLVATTQSSTIHSLIQTHVDYMSEPEQRQERVMFINRDIPDYAIRVASADTSFTTGSNTTTFTGVSTPVMVSAGDIFRPSETVVLGNGQTVDSSRVFMTVIDVSGSTVLCAGSISTVAGVTLESAVTGEFTSRNYQGGTRAEYVASIGSSTDNKRVVHVYPDVVKASVTRTTETSPVYNLVKSTSTENVNGTVAAAVLAAQSSSLNPAQPQSNMAVPGIVDVVNSNETLSKDNLDVMAGGGTWILVKARGGGAVLTRHHLTTAASTVDTREFSVVKSIDYAAKLFRTTLDPLKGKSIITDNFIKRAVWPTASAALNALVDGGIISSGSQITSIAKDTVDPTRLIIEVDLSPLYPANYFTVKLFI